MFKNRTLEMRVVKDNAPARPAMPTEKPFYQNPDEIRKFGRELTKGIIAVYAAVKVVDTFSQIAINACDRPKKK